jgi:hypothetical protein
MTAIHVYTQPGDYVAEFTVTIIFTITISASDDINVHVSPLPTESFLPANDLGSAGSEEQAIANQRAAVLSDGRIVIAGTAGAGVSPEIAVAVETLPGSRIFRHVARFAHLETKSLPESVKALGNGNIEIKAGDILYDVNPDSGVVNLSLHDVQEPEK